MPHYVVKDSSAHMPTKVKAPYRYVAILEMKPGFEDHQPSMISLRAKGVERIVYKSPPLHARGPGCAWVETYHAAHLVCVKLNGSLAVAAFSYADDRQGLQDYVDKLVQEELAKL
jgi:hypothetical protein